MHFALSVLPSLPCLPQAELERVKAGTEGESHGSWKEAARGHGQQPGKP